MEKNTIKQKKGGKDVGFQEDDNAELAEYRKKLRQEGASLKESLNRKMPRGKRQAVEK